MYKNNKSLVVCPQHPFDITQPFYMFIHSDQPIEIKVNLDLLKCNKHTYSNQILVYANTIVLKVKKQYKWLYSTTYIRWF